MPKIRGHSPRFSLHSAEAFWRIFLSVLIVTFTKRCGVGSEYCPIAVPRYFEILNHEFRPTAGSRDLPKDRDTFVGSSSLSSLIPQGAKSLRDSPCLFHTLNHIGAHSLSISRPGSNSSINSRSASPFSPANRPYSAWIAAILHRCSSRRMQPTSTPTRCLPLFECTRIGKLRRSGTTRMRS